jgi:hypothetical protein
MAAVSTPNLVVTKDLDNRIVHVKYTIGFDSFDQASNLNYKHVAQLMGDDTNVTGDPANAAPDEVLATLKSEVVQANGQAQVVVDFTQEFPKSLLNEDIGAPNPDEVRAKVTLTPILPVQIVRESNLYLESIS